MEMLKILSQVLKEELTLTLLLPQLQASCPRPVLSISLNIHLNKILVAWDSRIHIMGDKKNDIIDKKYPVSVCMYVHFFTVGLNFTFFAISSELFDSQKSIWYQNVRNFNALPMTFIFWKSFQSVKSYKETRFWYKLSKI